jgi:hypothetical protein
VAAYGVEVGVDAAAEAMAYAYAYERWHEVSAMSDPAGYLYRVEPPPVPPSWSEEWPRVGPFF